MSSGVFLLFVILQWFVSDVTPLQAQYAKLDADVTVSSSTPIALLSISLTLPEPCNVLIQSDGRFYPLSSSVSGLFLSTGKATSCSTFIDWKDSKNPVQHSFNLVDALLLPQGTHIIQLMALSVNSSPFSVGASSNLIVYPLNNYTAVTTSQLPYDSNVFSFNVWPIPEHLPHTPVLQVKIPVSTDGVVIALVSGRSYADGAYGDAMWILYVNHLDMVRNNETLHTDNDLWTYAEAGNAPMFTHAFFDLPPNSVAEISIDATAEPWGFCCNNVHYKIGAGLTLVALSGFPVVSRAILTSSTDKLDYICVGSNQNFPGCPPIGTPFVYASVSFIVPNNHSGEIMMMTKSLVQADSKDQGGMVSVQLKIDGRAVGSVGVQQVQQPDSDSTRTISASWVSTGDERLSPGVHLVDAVVNVVGSFIHLSFVKDIPIIVFG